MLPPGDLPCMTVAAARIWLVTKGGLVRRTVLMRASDLPREDDCY